MSTAPGAPARASEGEPQLPSEKQARALGPPALKALLPYADHSDPDVRMRARRLSKLVVTDFLKSNAPAGMVLVPGRIEIGNGRVEVVGGFYLGRREVTKGEFLEVARARGWKTERWDAKRGGRDLPVVSVSLREAREYAAARGARLPTLAELREAGTAGGRTRYPWGDRFDAARVNSREAGRGRLLPGDALPAGASRLGIRHLLGNAAEWTTTRANSSARRVFHYFVVGGSYRTWSRTKKFETYRLEETARMPDVGFRLAKSLPEIPCPGRD